jgi:hypothetical protein
MQKKFEAKHEDWHEEGEIVENRSNRSSVWNAEETSKVAHVVIIFFFICRHGVTSVRPPHCPQNFSPSVCLSVCLRARFFFTPIFIFIFAANSYSTMVNLLKQFFKKILYQIAAKKHLQTDARIQSQEHHRRRQHYCIRFPFLSNALGGELGFTTSQGEFFS